MEKAFTDKEAFELYEKYLVNACPVAHCKAPVGKMCESNAVWIHHERIVLLKPKN